MDVIICIWILYVLSHDVSNALFHHVTPHCRKFFSETSLDMSGENRKFMMKWDFPDESSDCHVISDELVFEVKFVSKVCQSSLSVKFVSKVCQ